MNELYCGSMNDLTTEEGEKEVMGNKILDLMNEVETYKQAIQDAKDALASAELELDVALSEELTQ